MSIRVEGLSKRYFIAHERMDGLRHRIERAARDPLGWLVSRTKEWKGKRDEFWALKDVSFEVKEGEIVGLVGRNGAGKSTLLKCLSRITEPTAGRIRMKGRVASLLEVGTGFHPELTGRENIYLNGAILGMTKSEIRRKFDEIVAFSEIERFLDTAVKHYSSGMYVRLAFAVAAHLEPEILLVDEVLAVGDASFQKKCLGKIGEVARSGRTVIFVSHNMEAIRRLCERGVLLVNGMIAADDCVGKVIDAYLDRLMHGQTRHENKRWGLAINQVALRNDEGREVRQFRPGDDLTVEISFKAQSRIVRPYFLLIIQGANGICFTANMLLDGHRPAALEGSGSLACRFASIPLLPQHYSVRMSIRAKDGKEEIFSDTEIGSFTVSANLEEYGYRGDFQSLAGVSTPVVVPYEWRLPDGSTATTSLARRRAEFDLVAEGIQRVP